MTPEKQKMIDLPPLNDDCSDEDVHLRAERWTARVFEVIDDGDSAEGDSANHAGIDAEWELIQRERQLRALLEEVEKGYWMVMVDEVVADWGCPQYRETDDGEAYYWCFPDHDLPVADNLSELFVAAAQLGARKPLDAPPAPASDDAREG